MIATSLPTLRGDLAHQRRAVDVVLRRAVREVEAHDVDAGADHALEHLRRRSTRGRAWRRSWWRGHGAVSELDRGLASARGTRRSSRASAARARGSRAPAASCLRAPRGRRRRRSRCSRCLSSMPYLAIAASVSPPPAMLNAVEPAIARAIVSVPLRERRRTRTRRPARSRRSCPPTADARPASRRSSGRCRGSGRRPRRRRPPSSSPRASALNSFAVTTSTGIGTSAPRAFIAAITARASSTSAGSARLLPIGKPVGEQEGVGDAAADDQPVDVLRPGSAGSSAWSRPCSRRRSRPAAASGCASALRDRVDLGGEQRPGAGDRRELGDAVGRRLGAVRGAERVVARRCRRAPPSSSPAPRRSSSRPC